MKRYGMFFALLFAAGGVSFATEDMHFITTLSAPIAVFDKVEASSVNEPARAKKATIGVVTDSSSFNTNVKLSTKRAHLRTLELNKNTTLRSTNVTSWTTPKISVRSSGSITGKRLAANTFDFKGGGLNRVNASNVSIGSNTTVASATASNTLNIANRPWYQTVNSVPTGGDAAWTDFTVNFNGSNKTFNKILNYAGGGPSSGATSGTWGWTNVNTYSSCSAGSVMQDTCLSIAGHSGNGLQGMTCTQCGVTCKYTPCQQMSGGYVYQEYTYECSC